MADIRGDILGQRLAEVLEDSAFAFSEPLPGGRAWDGELLVAELTFGDDGRLMLAMTAEYGEELAAGMLGLEPDDPSLHSQAADAAGELLNIVVGAWTPDVYGHEELVPLGTPRIRRMPPTAGDGLLEGAAGRASLLVDDMNRVDIAAFVEV